jgi:hypothetical protein
MLPGAFCREAERLIASSSQCKNMVPGHCKNILPVSTTSEDVVRCLHMGPGKSARSPAANLATRLDAFNRDSGNHAATAKVKHPARAKKNRSTPEGDERTRSESYNDYMRIHGATHEKEHTWPARASVYENSEKPDHADFPGAHFVLHPANPSTSAHGPLRLSALTPLRTLAPVSKTSAPQ